MSDTLQSGRAPKSKVSTKDTLEFYGRGLSGGKAGVSAGDIKSRSERLNAEVDRQSRDGVDTGEIGKKWDDSF